MSHVALRRVMIRLLHDPSFVDRVHADPDAALADVEVTAEERRWLLAEPRAAWRTDPARPGRVLAALAEEFPATAALAGAHMATFFSSAEFHAAVQERGSLALAFAEHAAHSADPRVRVLARLERAIAAARRAPKRAAASVASARESEERARVRLASTARVLRVPSGALALLAAVRAGDVAPALGDEEEDVLVVVPADGGDATVEALAPELAALLACAAGGIARSALLAEARRLGAEPGEDVEIVAALVADGVLIAADHP